MMNTSEMVKDMWGHATVEEKKYIQKLERRVDKNSSPLEQLIELTTLYIEPCHNYDGAIELIESILKRDPDNAEAKILMAFCCIHYLISDDDLEYARKILNEVIVKEEEGKHKGAAYKLLAEVLKDLGRLSLEEEISLLECSIKYEPQWVFNHSAMSSAYKKAGNFQKAIEHMEIAIENIVDEAKRKEWSLSQYYYESIITGRNYEKQYYSEDLLDLLQEKCNKLKKKKFLGLFGRGK